MEGECLDLRQTSLFLGSGSSREKIRPCVVLFTDDTQKQCHVSKDGKRHVAVLCVKARRAKPFFFSFFFFLFPFIRPLFRQQNSAMVEIDRARLITSLMAAGLSSVMFYFLMRLLYKQMDPSHKRSQEAKLAATKALRRLKASNVKLSEHETIIAADVADPSDLAETFDDVGGLDKTIQMLTEEVVLPFTRPELFNQGSKLLQPPKGVIVYSVLYVKRERE